MVSIQLRGGAVYNNLACILDAGSIFIGYINRIGKYTFKSPYIIRKY